MYKYKDIAFRPIEHRDLNILKELHNDDSTFLNLATIDMANEVEQEMWWKSIAGKSNDKRYAIVFTKKPEEIIGRLRIQNVDRQNQNCEVGLDILPNYRRQGYAVKSYEMLLEFLFNHYNMNMVYLKVADFNPNAKKLYEKIGFLQTGFFKDYYYRYGKYHNYLIMCMTKSNYSSKKDDK